MKHIKGFTFDNRKNNETHYGFLFTRYINIPCSYGRFKRRALRVWVPEDFNINKEYGVLYMSDGQNAVDANLTLYGEWDMEDHFLQLEKEGYPQFIIVGIDCPKNAAARTLEYLPGPCNTFKHRGLANYYGDKYADYLANNIVPYINSKFKIREDLVGFCGSSMGGLFSFYICSKYPEIFKFCISFSPAFFFFTPERVVEQFNRINFNQDEFPTYAFFIGGADKLERRLLPNTDLMVKLLKEKGYDDSHLLYMKDLSRIHHESTWSDFVEDALRFVLKNYKN